LVDDLDKEKAREILHDVLTEFTQSLEPRINPNEQNRIKYLNFLQNIFHLGLTRFHKSYFRRQDIPIHSQFLE
jgi:hypothetical protein